MEYLNEEQKIAEYHKQAFEGKIRALRRERYVYLFFAFVLLALISVVAGIIALVVFGVIEGIHLLIV